YPLRRPCALKQLAYVPVRSARRAKRQVLWLPISHQCLGLFRGEEMLPSARTSLDGVLAAATKHDRIAHGRPADSAELAADQGMQEIHQLLDERCLHSHSTNSLIHSDRCLACTMQIGRAHV